MTLQPVTPKEAKTAHTTEPKAKSIESKTSPDRLEPKPTTAEPTAPGAENLKAKIDAPAPDGAALIRVELGSALEVGDLHFQLIVDGQQVLDDNVDWGMGLSISDSQDSGLCWQTRLL